MHEVATSRRAVMRALATIPTMIAIPAVAQSVAGTVPASTAEWETAMLAYQRAKAAANAHQPIMDRAADAFQAIKPPLESIKLQPLSFAGQPASFVAHDMDLEKTWLDFLAGEGKWWNGERARQGMREDLDSIAAFRDTFRRADEATGFTVAFDRQEALDEAEYLAMDHMLSIPAPHRQAMLWKLDMLFGPTACGDSTPSYALSYVEPFFDDVRRLSERA
ncbi:hypothetical protein WG908_06320 [Sphingobium sp. AN641]|uniref:hypothetical protein n=1 Tax=Sphingobium sp. AN641 TaxID=3133443 RepID=UPI0030C3181C